MTKDQLINTSYDLSLILATASEGEDYHPDYKKDKNIFRKLVKSDVRCERKFKNYFKQFAEQRLISHIDWSAYSTKLIKASVIDDMVQVDWKEEGVSIRIILTDTLLDALIAGGEYTQKDLGIDIGFGPDNVPALNALRKHVIKLSGDLSQTTTDLIKHSLLESLSRGEPTREAAARLTAYIDNPKRAARIAHTESVRAFTQGQMAVASEIGATKKQWSATIKACQICSPLDNKIVDIDKEFASDIFETPAHPNCRCLLRILMR